MIFCAIGMVVKLQRTNMQRRKALKGDLRRGTHSVAGITLTLHRSGLSPWVRSSLRRLISLPSGVALDIPCGRGRHSRLLIELGFRVIGADLDIEALRAAVPDPQFVGRFVAVQLDATRPLPVAPESIDLLMVIHPHSLEVLPGALKCLRIGGYLIYETFGAQGENWRLLPKPRQIPDEILVGFDALACKETRVDKAPNFVTSKGLFQKAKP
jgi:SAM-dependent methyltransferase